MRIRGVSSDGGIPGVSGGYAGRGRRAGVEWAGDGAGWCGRGSQRERSTRLSTRHVPWRSSRQRPARPFQAQTTASTPPILVQRACTPNACTVRPVWMTRALAPATSPAMPAHLQVNQRVQRPTPTRPKYSSQNRRPCRRAQAPVRSSFRRAKKETQS